MRSEKARGPPTREKCAQLFGQVAGAAKALGIDDAEVIVASGTSALTRFANNAIHQNVAEHTTQLSVRLLIDGRTARASTNRLETIPYAR